MDTCEATKIVFSRIQSLDPDNASKAIGYILLQDPGEDVMIRIALGTDTLLLSLINHAKTHLGLSSNTLSASSTPSSPHYPFSSMLHSSRPIALPKSSPIITIPNNGFHLNPPSPPSSPWSISGFSDHRSPSNHTSLRPPSSISHTNVVNGNSSSAISGSPSASSSFLTPFYSNSSNVYAPHFQEQLSFLEDSSLNNVDLADRSISPDRHFSAFLSGGSVDGTAGGFDWKPCMYYARGSCKYGGKCKFMHCGGFSDSSDSSRVHYPRNVDGFDELLRMKAIQHQRLIAGNYGINYNLNHSPRYKLTKKQ